MKREQNILRIDKNVILFVLTAIVIFVLIDRAAMQVPMHSDDYGYYLKGITPSSHITHYLKWSGRFIADYTSSILLNLFSRPVYMALNSLAFLAVSIMVTLLPAVVRKEELIVSNSFIILWIVFIMYWSGNPNIGETSFWLVGSANYLWPLLWAGAYLLFILYFLSRNREISSSQLIILALLGSGAGLSNESLGFCMAFFSLCLFALYWKEKKNRKTLFAGLLSTSVGYAVLLFAPGNYARLSNDRYAQWHSMSLMERVFEHVYTRMTKAFKGFFLLYIVMVFMLIVILLIQKEEKNIQLVVFALGFAALSVCALFVFVVSPTMPRRSENTALFFTLLSLSFIADILMRSKPKISAFPLGCVVLMGMVFFVPSYMLIEHAYCQIMVQSQIREDMILDAKEEGSDTVTIPDWYFTRLLKDTDKIDTFRSSIMSKYYGMRTINWQNIDYNYAAIKTGKSIQVEQPFKDDVMLENIYTKLNPPYENTVVLEFDHCVADYAEAGEKKLYIHLFLDGQEEFVNADVSVDDFIRIGDKYYYGFTCQTPDLRKLYWIDTGLYNAEAQTKSAATSIDLTQYSDK